MDSQTQEAGEQIVFMITSGVSHRTRRPFVNVTVGARDLHAQLSPGEAIDLAHNLLEAAEGARSDAFLISWLLHEIGVDSEQAAVALLEGFRQWREQGQGEK